LEDKKERVSGQKKKKGSTAGEQYLKAMPLRNRNKLQQKVTVNRSFSRQGNGDKISQHPKKSFGMSSQ